MATAGEPTSFGHPNLAISNSDYQNRCDNCQGSFPDISNRMDQLAQRLFINGWERTKAVWAVPQGFGNETSVVFPFYLSSLNSMT